MSYIEFESAKDKERHRQELREAREELLKNAEARFHKRGEQERQKALRGDTSFLLPSIEKKLAKQGRTSKKEKKSKRKKSKKEKKQTTSDTSDSENDRIQKKKHRKKKKYSDPSSDSSSNSDSDNEWVEKKSELSMPEAKEIHAPLIRDDWMSNMLLPTYSKEKREPKKDRKDIDSYNPSKSVKELNPYWKDGGTGLPSFQKPKEDSDEDVITENKSKNTANASTSRGNWRKKEATNSLKKPSASKFKDSSQSSSESEKESEQQSSMQDFLTDQQMNELGAKIVKAEIMGNDDLAKEFKLKLERARECRKNVKPPPKERNVGKNEKMEVIVLTKTNRQGDSRPLQNPTSSDPYGSRTSKKKRAKLDTHTSEGQRNKFFPDDDRYDIKQMFEKEKFISASDNDAQFAKIAAAASKSSTRDNLEDIFAEETHKSMSDAKMDERERNRAVEEHQKTARMLENCEFCIDSAKIEKQLIIALGSKVYLSLPRYEGLQKGHCLISTMSHVSCSTQLDEEVWAEVNDFRKALTRMFDSRKQDVIFFETARYLHRKPHMVIHCVPSKDFEMAPFYFKKAIQESEREWSMNKQLIDLRKEKKDVRRAIPRTLPYFWVNFGMSDGFAHVIEEQERFPPNFAEEVIAGILELDPRVYRKPRRDHNPIPKVKQFADWWKHYDCTKG
ncbi:unnamed protein product [Sphagnum compactum]